MIFLKLTRSAKTFFTRFGWLIAELVFVFLGLYGAFLLERMHDDEMDLMRKSQILQALTDEFVEYSVELSEASSSLDEAYGIPFFSSYQSGERPFPQPIPYGGLGSVNTGIWVAMLQSGGIEVLEVELIQQVQLFFKKLQDFLDLYTRFERLTESMVLPEMDQDTSFFYEPDGPELRDKYKWYVNQLFQIGMSLRALSEQAISTQALLEDELAQTLRLQNNETLIPSSSEERIHSEQGINEENDEAEVIEEEPEIIPDETESNEEGVHGQALAFLAQESDQLCNLLTRSSKEIDEKYGAPFLESYSLGDRPIPIPVVGALFQKIDLNPIKSLLQSDGIDQVLESELLATHRRLVAKLEEVQGIYLSFSERCQSELTVADEINNSQFYLSEEVVLKENFIWYPNTLFTLMSALGDCSNEAKDAFSIIEQRYPEVSTISDDLTESSLTKPQDESDLNSSIKHE